MDTLREGTASQNVYCFKPPFFFLMIFQKWECLGLVIFLNKTLARNYLLQTSGDPYSTLCVSTMDNNCYLFQTTFFSFDETFN
jgi:hypothetical protein